MPPEGGVVPNSGAVVIAGPPCSGKTTLAKTLPGRNYDLDDFAELLGLPRYDRTIEEDCIAARARNEALSRHDPKEKVVLVIGGARHSERKRWAEALSAEVKLLRVHRAELLRRVDADDARRKCWGSQRAAIFRWFERAC